MDHPKPPQHHLNHHRRRRRRRWRSSNGQGSSQGSLSLFMAISLITLPAQSRVAEVWWCRTPHPTHRQQPLLTLGASATRKNPGTHSLLGKIQINLNKRKAGPAQRQRRTCCAQLANKFSRMSSAGIVLRPPLSPRRRRSDLHDFFFFRKKPKIPEKYSTLGHNWVRGSLAHPLDTQKTSFPASAPTRARKPLLG